MNVNELQSDLTNTQLYQKIKNLITEATDQLKEDFSHSLSQISSRLQNAESTIASLKEVNKELTKTQKEYLREIKRNNILIFGVNEDENEDLYQLTKDFIKTHLKVDLRNNEINHIYRFGPSRTIVVRLTSFHKKIDLLRNGHLLKNTGYSVTSDLIKEDREKQKVLRSYLKEARNQGKEAKIKNNKLIVENKVYTVEDIQKLETENCKEADTKQLAEQKTTTKTVSIKDNTDQKITEPNKASSNLKPKVFHRSATNARATAKITTSPAMVKTRSKIKF